MADERQMGPSAVAFVEEACRGKKTCWHRGCTGRADLSRGEGPTRAVGWYTWQVLKSIGREVDWDVEHVGGCKRKTVLVEMRSGANDLEIEREGVGSGLKLRKGSVAEMLAVIYAEALGSQLSVVS